MRGQGMDDEGVMAEAFVSFFFACYVPLCRELLLELVWLSSLASRT
jgi:hypothetical protein